MCRDNVIPAPSANISLSRARLVSEDQGENTQQHLEREVNTKHYQCVPEHSAPHLKKTKALASYYVNIFALAYLLSKIVPVSIAGCAVTHITAT
jgi:hypothetical protein